MSRACAGFERHPESDALGRFLVERWGLPADCFNNHHFWHRPGSPAIWIAARDCSPPPALEPVVETVGMLALRHPPPGGKPTSVFLQRFGLLATRNVYRLSEVELARFIAGEPVAVEPVDAARGYCIVRTRDAVVGCGRIDDGQLWCELPKSWRRMLG